MKDTLLVCGAVAADAVPMPCMHKDEYVVTAHGDDITAAGSQQGLDWRTMVEFTDGAFWWKAEARERQRRGAWSGRWHDASKVLCALGGPGGPGPGGHREVLDARRPRRLTRTKR